ncbi:MAG: polysaccharide deacetylase family protein [Terriglobia bacterium]
MYHRVCPLFFDKQIPYANVYPEEFEKQIAFIAEKHEGVTVTEFLRRRSAGELTGNEICITFDDGFRDNYLFAFPILRKYGVPANFFLVTKYIGSDELFPWVPLDEGGKSDFSRHRENWIPMNWENVKEMMESGMEFGTHTHTHSHSLSELSLDVATQELKDCTALFKARTGLDPKVFCFPHGTTLDYNREHIEMIKSLGYQAALTTNIGRNSSSQDPFELKRLIVYEEDSLQEVKKKAQGAYDFVGTLQKGWLWIAGAKKYSDYE